MARAVNQGLAEFCAPTPSGCGGWPRCRCRRRSAPSPCSRGRRGGRCVGVEIGTAVAGGASTSPRSSRSGPRPSGSAYRHPPPGLHRAQPRADALLLRERARLPVRHDDRDRAADRRRRPRPPSGAPPRPAPRRRLLPLPGGPPAPRAHGAARARRRAGGSLGLSRAPALRHHHPRSESARVPDRAGRPRSGGMGTDLPFDMATPEPMGLLEPPPSDEAALAIAERNPAALYGFPTPADRPRRATPEPHRASPL